MGPFFAVLKKEVLLLSRDLHALLLLFAMPCLFILIMSLAMRDTFAGHRHPHFFYAILVDDGDPRASALAAAIRETPDFSEAPMQASPEALQGKLLGDQLHFLVHIPSGFSAALTTDHPIPLELQVAPGLEPIQGKLFMAALKEALAKVYVQQLMFSLKKDLGPLFKSDKALAGFDVGRLDSLISSPPLERDGRSLSIPSSVQHNVPAWLIFAMFFIAIPISGSWVIERGQGSFMRLSAMGISPALMLWGKLLPYVGVNLLQVALMLGVGVFVVPRLGGDALDLGVSPAGLLLLSLSLSFACVAFALLIANVVNSSEEATILSGASNLVLAALGGIMVPRFVMPLFMQKVSLFSPMAWGLEGFMELFVHQGGLPEVLPWAALLGAFASVSLFGAFLSLGMRRGR